MSTRASRTSEPSGWASDSRGRGLLGHLDLLVLAAALPVFILAGLSPLSYAAIAVAWLVQKALGLVLERRAEASRDPKTVAGLMVGGTLGRAFLTFPPLVAVAIADEEAGLPALLLVFVLFTVYFLTKVLQRALAVG